MSEGTTFGPFARSPLRQVASKLVGQRECLVSQPGRPNLSSSIEFVAFGLGQLSMNPMKRTPPGASISDTILFGFTANASLNKAFGLQSFKLRYDWAKGGPRVTHDIMTILMLNCTFPPFPYFFYTYSHRGIVFRFQQ